MHIACSAVAHAHAKKIPVWPRLVDSLNRPLSSGGHFVSGDLKSFLIGCD